LDTREFWAVVWWCCFCEFVYFHFSKCILVTFNMENFILDKNSAQEMCLQLVNLTTLVRWHCTIVLQSWVNYGIPSRLCRNVWTFTAIQVCNCILPLI
jgi:hypothetical protein